MPRVQIITRKGYGGAYVVMNSKSIGADIAFAWPSAEIAVMGADGAVNIIFRREIEIGRRSRGAPGRARRASTRSASLNPYQAAERGYVDDVIDPRDTRRMLARALAMLRTKREQLPAAQARQRAALMDRRDEAEVVGGNPSPEQVAAIVAALSVIEAERRRRGRGALEQPEPMSMWVEASRRSAQRAGMQRGPWRLSGRLGKRSRV